MSGRANQRPPCGDRSPLVEAMFDGRLGLSEVSSLERHLKSCPSCAELLRDLTSLRRNAAILAGLDPAPRAPARSTRAARDTAVRAPTSDDPPRCSSPLSSRCLLRSGPPRRPFRGCTCGTQDRYPRRRPDGLRDGAQLALGEPAPAAVPGRAVGARGNTSAPVTPVRAAPRVPLPPRRIRHCRAVPRRRSRDQVRSQRGPRRPWRHRGPRRTSPRR